MYRVHFIGIGGETMHNLALALKKKNNYIISGSDENFRESARSGLQEHGLLPQDENWHPEKISKYLSAVIIGRHIRLDNPELAKAKELKLKIYSLPEYFYQQTRNKTRLVVCGDQGKETTAALIFHALKKSRMDADYILTDKNKVSGNMIRLSFDSRIALIDGDEHQTSVLDERPKLHHYKPHIAIVTSTGTDNNPNTHKAFIETMETQGRIIYNSENTFIRDSIAELRRDLVGFPYRKPETEIIDGQVTLINRKKSYPINITDHIQLLYIQAAMLACRQIGITEDAFLNSMKDFVF